MTLEWRRAALQRLRPRDVDVVVALLENPEKSEAVVASMIGMSAWTLRGRLRHVRVVLDVETRAHLQAAYQCLLLGCPLCR